MLYISDLNENIPSIDIYEDFDITLFFLIALFS